MQKTASTTILAAAFAAFLAINAVLFLLGERTVFAHVWAWMTMQARLDSWGPMVDVLERLKHPSDMLIYDDIFFSRHVKFQYPLSSLLPIAFLEWIFGEHALYYAKALSWLSIPFAAAATGWLCGILLRRAAPGMPPREAALSSAIAACAAMIFVPLILPFWLGQVQTWNNALFALACILWAFDRRLLTGACIGIVCLIKPQFGLFVLWAALRRQWRFLGGWAAMFVPGSLAAVAIYGFANNFNYVKALTFMSRHGEGFFANQSVNGLLNRMFFNGNNLTWSGTNFPTFNLGIYLATLGSSLALIGFALFWRRNGAGASGLVDFMIAALSFTIASPIAWEHHYGILPPILAATFAAIVTAAPSPWKIRCCAMLAVVYVAAGSFLRLFDRLAATPFNFVQSYLLFAALGLLAMLYCLRDRPEGLRLDLPQSSQRSSP